MKISEIKGEKACDFLLEVLEPMQEIAKDKKVSTAMANGKPSSAAKVVLSEHKKSALEIVCLLKGVDIKDADTITPVDILKTVLEILSDKEILALFTLQD